MSDYTIKNLRDIDDAAVAFGLAPDVEARFARDPLGCEKLGLSFQRLAPGVRQSFGHRHEHQEEVYVVLGGSARVNVDGEVVELGPWDAVRVSPETMRAFEAGPDGVELLAVGAPIGPAPDAEIAQGWWGE